MSGKKLLALRRATASSAVLVAMMRCSAAANAVTLASNPRTSWPAAVFAPYVDVTLYPTPQLGVMSAASGAKYYTLAFLNADTSNSSIASWGGYDSLPVASASATNASWDFGYNLITGINAVRASGGDVMASFGGANGTPIDSSITNTNALIAQYQNIISTYHLTAIDFDVEGSWTTDASSIARRSATAAALQKANPGLKVWLTLPVAPSGLTYSGLNVVNSALNAGVQLSGVNIMAMDYGIYHAPMGTDAISAANATHSQLKTAFAAVGDNYTDAQIWTMQGITAMIGVNDTTSETFTVSNAQQVLTFAQQNKIGYLSMWSGTRDHTGSLPVSPTNSSIAQSDYQFSTLLAQYGTTGPINSQWNSATGGSWGSGTNWSDGIPDSPASVATFSGLTAASVISIDFNRTVGQLLLNNPAPLNFTGGSLTIDNTGASTTGGVVVTAGNHTVASPIALASGATVSLASNCSLSLSGVISGTGGLTLSGAGALTLSNSETYTGLTSVVSGTLTISPGANLPAGSAVSVSGGGDIILARLPAAPLAVVSLASVTSDTTSRFDLTGNDLVLTATTLKAVTSLAALGYQGNWQTGGLVSSWAAADLAHGTAVGVIQNNQSGSALYTSTTPFDGYTPNAGDVLVKYTYYGDTNLDGKVDGSDYSRIDAAFLADVSKPGSVTGWFNGDFNYDGVIDGSDYTLIDNAFNTQGATLSVTSNALIAAEIAPANAVPEPSCLVVVGISTLLSRRRRQAF